MTIRIEICGESASEALKELSQFAAGLVAANVPAIVAATPAAPAPKTPEAAAPAAPEKTTGRGGRGKKNTTAEQVQAAPVQEPAGAEAQDAADEAEEVEETRDTKNPLTLEDVKFAMNGYVKKFGMAATQEDGPKIFVEALGQPPAKEPYWKLSLVPDDQDAYEKIIATWRKATELNPLKRTPV